MSKYILNCNPYYLEGFVPNYNNEYMFYRGLGKGELLSVDLKTNEIEFSDKILLKLIEGKYIEVD